MPFDHDRLAAVATFKGLHRDALALLARQLDSIEVPAGTVLVEEGAEHDALFIVVTGRFSVEVAGNTSPVAEIGNGATIGEIAFFAGGKRTATCRAIRDSVVLRLTRKDFETVSRADPAIWSNITATLAERLAAETRKSAALKGVPSGRPRPRTIAIVPAGQRPCGRETLDVLAASYPASAAVPLTSASAFAITGTTNAGSLTQALNNMEQQDKTILYVADPELTSWSRLAIRQADEVLLVAEHDPVRDLSSVPLNELEQLSYAQPGRSHRLLLLHNSRRHIEGTRHWLAHRPVTMHHHAILRDADSIARLWRFTRGEARGFVACGGGAYCAAHIGIYRAFCETGTRFDIFGGSSGGAAMAAAFAEDLDAGDISDRVQATFIDGKAMRRYTIPRYGLLDHTHFDTHMRKLYGSQRVEDLWRPFFAVALDLGNVSTEVIRAGPVWASVRASAAIPGLLPPYIDDRGRLLVDGSVTANVPIDIMHQMKSGPNVVVTFAPPLGLSSRVAYDALPGRNEILKSLVNPWGSKLPAAPSAASVLVRTLMANRNHFENHLEPSDWLLMPPLPPSLGALDWRPHREIADQAYKYAKREIAGRM